MQSSIIMQSISLIPHVLSNKQWEFFPLYIIAGSLESAYSLIWGFHEILGKGRRDTLALLW